MTNMKTIKTFAAAIAMATVSFTTFAAEHVSAQDAAQFEKAGVIVASGATDLSSLKSQLAAKADAAGAKAFTITSTSGNNLMHATAVIYK
jgi:multiple stress resistance protein BhsA